MVVSLFTEGLPGSTGHVELQFSGVWWPVMGEGISVKAMLLGWKAPGAKEPQKAA